jgi:hypothetical protein
MPKDSEFQSNSTSILKIPALSHISPLRPVLCTLLFTLCSLRRASSFKYSQGEL